MTVWWFYLVAIPTALLLSNGIPHFVQGMSGNRFPSPFSGGPGTGDEPWRNVLWGASNLVIGGVLLWVIRDGLGRYLADRRTAGHRHRLRCHPRPRFRPSRAVRTEEIA